MPAIKDIRVIPLAYELGAGKAYGSSRGQTPRRVCGLVELETSDGVVGIGEAWGDGRITRAYLDAIRGHYVGRDVFDHELVWPLIQAKHYHMGIQNQLVACVSGIDIAAKDAIGKILNLPLCKLLGGKARDRIPVYASGGYVTDDPQNQLERQLERVADRGYSAYKIKIGLSIASDIERCALARRIIGSSAQLFVDINGNYTADLVLASMRAVASSNIAFVEEPLPPQDYDGYEFLQGRVGVPVAVGEAHYTMHDFDRLARPRRCDILQPDLTLCGGLQQGRAIAMLAQLHNLRLSPHVWGGAVGLAAALHYMAALPATPHGDVDPAPWILEHDVGDNGLRDALLTEPLAARDGFIAVPDGPGLGVTIDSAGLKRLRAD
ncbi:MAG: mandelate racemase/muconate lactonizing enzyme family protein [Alphaproteobacteria bacterium]|nr:mandelate racemase/muconate lactonizing enzyme family protein [Alphaproteobacteria bacterium]